jgi:seryl-tRNA synthetase
VKKETAILDKLFEIEAERRDLLKTVEQDRQLRNSLSQEIGTMKKEVKDESYLLLKAK